MALTGRPKSDNPRDVVVSIRITRPEKEQLDATYGSAAKGLRRALDFLVRAEPTASAEGSVVADVIAVHGAGGGNPIEVDPELRPRDGGFMAGIKTERHAHKPAVLVSSRHDRGDLLETWECECGTYLPERKAK